MFALSLKAILATFEKVQTQLEEFLVLQQEKLQVNADKQSELAHAATVLTADQEKAQRVLDRVKALTE